MKTNKLQLANGQGSHWFIESPTILYLCLAHHRLAGHVMHHDDVASEVLLWKPSGTWRRGLQIQLFETSLRRTPCLVEHSYLLLGVHELKMNRKQFCGTIIGSDITCDNVMWRSRVTCALTPAERWLGHAGCSLLCWVVTQGVALVCNLVAKSSIRVGCVANILHHFDRLEDFRIQTGWLPDNTEGDIRDKTT